VTAKISSHLFKRLVLLLAILSNLACQNQVTPPQKDSSTVKHPEWSYNASIYEVNLRQYSAGGTFTEFEAHLPRLKNLGVDILWFMPIHPIGVKNRKGTLGSYYSVKDYLAVNPEHGTLEEFKALVKKIHELEMYVIIDWVANHTAWDNPLTIEHPEWYTKNANGNFVPPVPDWSDVIDLNYDQPGLRAYMIGAMKFWVQETDIDGFRCDVAGMVPTDFWVAARAELEKIKPVFMLAEWEDPEHHQQAFDMSYSWEIYRTMNRIAAGQKNVSDLVALFEKDARDYPRDAFRMRFTDNHDENSWNGTVFERLGDGVATFAVLAATIPGMPLIYSGQEAGLNKRLQFFEKDPIEWREHEFAAMYSILFHLKKQHPALWNGERGGELVRVSTSNDQVVCAFIREKAADKIFVVLNLSDEERNVTFTDAAFAGEYTEVFSNEKVSFTPESSLNLKPWKYKVFVK
jgi:glycosidase